MLKNNTFKIVVAIFSIIAIYFAIKPFSQNRIRPIYRHIVDKNSSCISCHTSMQGFAPAHGPDKMTCIACHLGDSNSFEKEDAHENMLLVPGNLSNASETCAKCHPGIDLRVKNSLMNTMSGIISVDKYVFDENDDLDSIFNIHHLANQSPADSHLRNKCASCHIGNEKTHPSPITEESRGGGCTACHLNYSEEAKLAHQKYINSDKTVLTTFHPSLSLKITDNHCFGCHSRSGRISTNYEGWHETQLKEIPRTDSKKYRILEDQRIFEKQAADIHHAMGLSCVDCHDSNDVMGDGNIYTHQEDAVSVKCIDCHFSSQPKTASLSDLSTSDQRIVRLKRISSSNVFVYALNENRVLLNVIRKNDENYLITKNTDKTLQLSPPSANCTKDVHENISCSACHTEWSPQCISCHTSFDKMEDSFDLLAKEWVMGKWVEKGNDFLAEFPTLGVTIKQGKKEINTFAPGMVMHLQRDSQTTNFYRLFAPVSAHTISKKGKSCEECHNNSVALGYGRGDLTYTKAGIWQFKPSYELEEDGLPKDAWIPFLSANIFALSTRNNTRPFSIKEQQKILRVGACLSCHKEGTNVINSLLDDFENTLESTSKQCVLPVFE